MNGLAEFSSITPPETVLSTDAQAFLTAMLALGQDLAASDKASLLAIMTVMQNILSLEIERTKRLIASNARIVLRLKTLSSNTEIPTITEISERLTSVKAAMSKIAEDTHRQATYAAFETGFNSTMIASLSALSDFNGNRNRVNAIINLARQDAARLEAYLNKLRDVYSVVDSAVEDLS